MPGPDPISEVADLPLQEPSNETDHMSLFSNMEKIFQRIADKLTANQPTQSKNIQLVTFDPDEKDADIINWCTLSELIIENKKLEGVDLILALTHCLKGRAALCLTKIKPDKITWAAIKQTLISMFAKPMTMQDYFDQVVKFQIDLKESPAEAGMRLWQLIEKIPDVDMPENVITGFAMSVLSQCDEKIRRELNSVVITNKNQLFRTLRGFSLKRRSEDPVSSDSDAKHYKNSVPFRGNCNFCGKIGHRAQECRNRERFGSTNSASSAKHEHFRQTTQSGVTGGRPPVQDGATSGRLSATCYVCGSRGHLATTCPMRYKKDDVSSPSTTKQVNTCTKASHGLLQISEIE